MAADGAGVSAWWVEMLVGGLGAARIWILDLDFCQFRD